MTKSASAEIPSAVRRYFAEIGRKGGSRSRRILTPEQSKAMLKVREARRAFKRFRTVCFWSYNPDLKIGIDDIEWIARTLRKNGNRQAWEVADYLCR
jgi:hypothetical protein